MARSFAYDHANYLIVREELGDGVVNNGTGAFLNCFQARYLKNVHAYVKTAGTAAGAAINWIKVSGTATTTIGTTTMGTNAARTRVSLSPASPVALAADDIVYGVSATDVTMAARVYWETQYDSLGSAT